MSYTIPSSSVTPGTVYQPKRPPILNRISGAIAAWSTRRLISTAPADIARGRDASTNEEDFTAAELAGTGFTTLAGAGDGFYVTLYDQIGSNNATQSTAASQPKGVNSGALIINNKIPSLLFDGTDVLRVADNSAFDLDTELSVFVFAKNLKSTLTGNEFLVSKYDTGLNKREWLIGYDSDEKLTCLIGSADGSSYSEEISDTAIDISSDNCIGFVYNAGSVDLYLNGGVISSSTTGTHVSTLNNEDADILIGASQNNSNAVAFFDGHINDVMVFNRSLSSAEALKLYNAIA